MSESNGHAAAIQTTRRDGDAIIAVVDRVNSGSHALEERQRRPTTRQAAAATAVNGPNTRNLALGAAAAVTAVAVAIGFVRFAYSSGVDDAPAGPRILPVRTMVVQPVSSYLAEREYTGAVVARRTAELGFELAGKLNEIHVEEGARVAADQPLARIDTEHLSARRREFVAKRAQAAALLAEMETGPRQEDIAAARSRVVNRQAQVELSRLQHARRRELLAKRAISREQYEEFAFGLKAQEAQLAEARHDLAELLNGTRKEQIAAQRAAVQALDASIADIDVDLRKSTLRAPFAGTIARREADEGTVVQAGRPILRLVEDGALEAWVGLPVKAAGSLVEGSDQQVKIGNRRFSARLSGRFPEVDPATRTRTVVLKLDEAASREVVHGQVVRLSLEETIQTHGYWVPSTALSKGARGLWSLLATVETGGSSDADRHNYRVERRDVEVLFTDGDRVLVRGTLQPGERVIRGGTHRVVPGQLVRPVQ